MDCIVHGILQARVLQWTAIPWWKGWEEVAESAGAAQIYPFFIEHTPVIHRLKRL